MADYADELCAEVESRRSEIAGTLGVNTLYIGGGTPSVLPLSVLARIVDCIGHPGGAWQEFTVEVNPDDISTEYASGLLKLGVSRVSMGVQSLDDGVLEWMNRRHDAAGALRAFRSLRREGADNISVDVIFGVPGMTDAMLSDTLDKLVALRPEHISAYQLSIGEGSLLAELINSGELQELGEDECRRQYGIVCRMLREAGYRHYEISNWAIPGHEAVHNSAYWRRAPYVGLGPGAHSLSVASDGTQIRSWNSDTLSGWTPGHEVLTQDEIREEEIMLGLRTDSGWNGRVLTEEEWFTSDGIIASLF